jgi:hypothetical protein
MVRARVGVAASNRSRRHEWVAYPITTVVQLNGTVVELPVPVALRLFSI